MLAAGQPPAQPHRARPTVMHAERICGSHKPRKGSASRPHGKGACPTEDKISVNVTKRHFHSVPSVLAGFAIIPCLFRALSGKNGHRRVLKNPFHPA